MVGKCDYLPFTDNGWDKEKLNDLVKAAHTHTVAKLSPVPQSWHSAPTHGVQF